MIVQETIKQTREQVKIWRREGRSIGLVPTMGFLHEGHASLIRRSVADNDRTLVSIFVNPMQFSPGEDLEAYPRDMEKDLALCESLGADLVFTPAPEEMYGRDFFTYVDMTTVTEGLCGDSRPNMFRGVCTVVSKLFHIAMPDRAYFGKKDAQQLAVIRQMVKDLNFDLAIVGCDSVREADGLAMSSRNSYLTEEERAVAPKIYQALLRVKDTVDRKKKMKGILCDARGMFGRSSQDTEGNTATIPAEKLTAQFLDDMRKEPLFDPEYAQIVDGRTMQPVEKIAGDGGCLMAVAVRLGKARLIDNIEL